MYQIEQGTRLVAGVDFIICPVRTLIVYKLGKPRLKIDLTLIELLQIACLTYGMWLVYQQRPLAVIYADVRFYPLAARYSDGLRGIDTCDGGVIELLEKKQPNELFPPLGEGAGTRACLVFAADR